MTDSTGPHLDDPIDRYVRRELTAAEARDLAQQSLSDPELFEDLTDSALAAAAAAPSTAKIVRFPRKTRFVVAGVAAAAVVLVMLYSSHPHQPPLKPTLALSSTPSQPILLASGLQPSGLDQARAFRSAEPEGRSPRPAGSVVSIEDGSATINLGSIDGLEKGSEAEVFRGDNLIGHLTITTVFRDRARGQISAGAQIQANDQVRAPAAAYLDALLQQIDAMSGRGDLDAARNAAKTAAEWAEAKKVPPVELERLATLEYRLGLVQAAEKHYQAAEPQASFDSLNSLAVLRMLRGDYAGAETPLTRVVSTSPKTDPAYPQSLNNLGVLAEVRGDRRKAQQFYTEALHALDGAADSNAPERQTIEANLSRIRGID